MTKFQLRIKSAAGPERLVPIDPSREMFTIGREKGNDLQIGEPKASREHCQLVRRESGFELQDLNSSNGTRVDGQRIKSHMLSPGQSFAIGATHMVLEAIGAGGGGAGAGVGGGLAARKDLYVEVLDGIRDRFFSVEAGMTTVSIGRDETCTIVIEEKRSSRRHCELVKRGKELVVVDLGSSNGTKLNGKPVTEAALRWSDEIGIGQTRIIIGERNAEQASDEQADDVFAMEEGPSTLELKDDEDW